VRWVPGFRRRVGAAERLPTGGLTDADPHDLVGELRTFLAARVREGYLSRSLMIEGATDFLSDEFPTAAIDRAAPTIVDELLAQHAASEATWDAPTDPDRLSEVFVRLDSTGLVARENFADCQTCGFGEISDEIRLESKHREIRGFTFFHEQDTERAATNGTLYLSYGTAGSSGSAAEVGREIADALSTAGLHVTWDGSPNTRIEISDLDWRRRRFGRQTS
jgi:hypothetical protein